jgi:hypothetical protein
MKTHLIGAFAIAGSAALFAATPQSQTPSTNQTASTNTPVTVSGCVMQAERNGSLADDTSTGISSTPATAPVDANTAQPVNAYLLTSAERIAPETEDTTKDAATSYALVGHEQELAKHKGHRVEVHGQLMAPRPGIDSTAGRIAASNVQRIAVDSIKMLNVECAAPKQPDVR